MTGAESLAILQRFVDTYAADVAVVQAAVADSATPAAARRPLVGALAYAVDAFDFFPDTTKGLGTVDDAIVLRVAAKAAVGAGAPDLALGQLARDTDHIDAMFGELAPSITKLVAALPDRKVAGKTTDEVLASKDAMVTLEANVKRELARYQAQPIDLAGGGPERAVIEVKKMLAHAAKKAGV